MRSIEASQELTTAHPKQFSQLPKPNQLGLRSGDVEPFVRFCDNMIDYCLNVVRALISSQLSVGSSALAHDALDVRHLGLVAEFVHLGCYKCEHLVKQVVFVYLAFSAEIDQLAVDAIACCTPAV